MEKDRGLWKLPDGRNWWRGKLGLVMMGRAMLSKWLIQFSVDGWGCVLVPCYLTWGQTTVEVMKIMVTSFKRSHANTGTLSAPSPVTGHCWPIPPPETLGYSQVGLGQSLSLFFFLGQSLVGSLLLSPGSWYVQSFVCALQEFVSQSCVSSGSSMLGLMVTLSKRAYALLKSSALDLGSYYPGWEA